MSKLISCDTNILLYSLNSSCPEFENSKEFIESNLKNNNFCICELVLLELYVLLRSPKILKKPFESKDAVEVCQQFKKNPNWRVIDYAPETASSLWLFARRKNSNFSSIFDARLALTLIHHGIREFATRNTKDFKDFDLKLINPID